MARRTDRPQFRRPRNAAARKPHSTAAGRSISYAYPFNGSAVQAFGPEVAQSIV